jgi:hypothetical protein
MVGHLLIERVGVAAGIGLQFNGQLPVRVEQPSMTRFEVSATLVAVE